MIERAKVMGVLIAGMVLLGLLAMQTFRLHASQLEVARMESTLASERAAASAALAAKTAQARRTEQELQQAAHQTRKEKDDAIATLTAHRDALLKRLRDAQHAAGTRLPGTAATASTGQAALGDGGSWLPAPLGEQDVDEAHRADVIRLALLACYRQYDAARQALSQ